MASGKRFVLLTGPNLQALNCFANSLQNLFAICDRDIFKCSSSDLKPRPCDKDVFKCSSSDLKPRPCDNDVFKCSSNDLKPRPCDKDVFNLEPRPSCVYFLVMPRSNRYNLYVEGDKSSMEDEIKLMCGGLPQDNVKGGDAVTVTDCSGMFSVH